MANCRKYAAPFANTPPAQSSTVPIFGVNGAATCRLRLYQWLNGSDTAPANAAIQLTISRITTALATGTAVTPRPLDSADPASTSTAMQGPSIGAPTITANSSLWQQGLNQNNSLREFFQDGYEIVVPATANNGLCLLPIAIGGTAFDCVGTWFFTE